MRRPISLLSSLALGTAVFVVAACGETTSDRAISGGAIGAGAGAATGAVTGGSAVGGAILGGAAGAATGAVTDQDDIDLGDPVWRR
jgi:osmotically inducible lipoprotein OsmB